MRPGLATARSLLHYCWPGCLVVWGLDYQLPGACYIIVGLVALMYEAWTSNCQEHATLLLAWLPCCMLYGAWTINWQEPITLLLAWLPCCMGPGLATARIMLHYCWPGCLVVWGLDYQLTGAHYIIIGLVALMYEAWTSNCQEPATLLLACSVSWSCHGT